MNKFTEAQIQAWKQYEQVRKSGKFNMFDPRARAASGLSRERYTECITHYDELKKAATATGSEA